ncbi:MAG: fumarylacetoacetate hydrolase family protein [Phycisphaeraceae bacterium]|nr:MAG: fumarylacetoacetate hydrolase family protein [Phycisphaeraceae bacterium]
MKFTRVDHEITIEGADLAIRHIIGVGRNYAEHAHEQGAKAPERPMLFCKNPAALALEGEDIVIPEICQDRLQVDYEGELGVVIGQRVRDVPEEMALSAVLGYCIANDVSARWWQKEGAGGQFYRGKSFDTFCPIGPRLTAASHILDPQALHITTSLNGEVMQDAPTSQMLFPVATLIAELSRGTTLLPGTLILTGTPSGVGMARSPQRFLQDGDEVRIAIEGLGELANRVRLEKSGD